MRNRTRNIVAVILAGALMATAAPAAAQAQPAKDGQRAEVSRADMLTKLAPAYGIKNIKSQKVLQPGSASVGSQVTQQTDVGSALQSWEIVADGSYSTFWNAAPPRLNMGVNGASTAAGAVAIVANGSSHANQDWLEQWRSDTQFNLKNRHSGLCLGIDGASTSNGARAMQFACNTTAPNQRWAFVA